MEAASADLIHLVLGIFGVLIVASIIGYVLEQRLSPDGSNAAIENLNARIKAWWVMVVLIGIAFVAGRAGVILLFAFCSFAALREFVTLINTRRADHWALAAAFFVALHPFALQLCLIIFVWTPPHFWALAIFRRDDYSRAQVPMLPVTHGVVFTRWHVLFYTILLVLVTLLPALTGYSGMVYLGGAAVLGAGFLYYAVRLLNPPDEFFAMKVFNYSIVYLMALFAFLLVDHWVMEPLIQHQGVVFERSV